MNSFSIVCTRQMERKRERKKHIEGVNGKILQNVCKCANKCIQNDGIIEQLELSVKIQFFFFVLKDQTLCEFSGFILIF